MTSKTPESPTPRPRRPHKLRRRILKTTAWLLGFLLLAAAVAWHWRVDIANALLRKYAPDLDIQVRGVNWTDGGLDVSDVTVQLPGASQPLATLEKGHVELSLGGLKKGRLGKVKLVRPAIRMDEDFFRWISRPSPNTPTQNSDSVFSIEGIEIRQAEITLTGTNGHTLSAVVDWQGGAAELFGDSSADAAAQTITLTNLQAGSPHGAALSAESLEVQASLARSSRTLTIHALKARGWNLPSLRELLEAAGIDPAAATGGAEPAAEVAAAPESPDKSPVRAVVIEHCEVEPMNFVIDTVPGVPGAPPIRGKLSATGASLGNGSAGAGRLMVQLEEVLAGASADLPLASVPRIQAELASLPDGSWKLERLTMAPSSFHIRREDFSSLGLTPGLPLPEVSGSIEAGLSGWNFQDGKLAASGAQIITLRNVTASIPQTPAPFLTLERMDLEADPQEFLDRKRLRRLHLQNPKISLTGDVLTYFSAPDSTSASSASGAPAEAFASVGDSIPFYDGLVIDDLKAEGGSFSGDQLAPGVPAINGAFQILTLPRDAQRQFYRLECSGVQVSTPGLPKAPPLYRGASLIVEADSDKLWREKEIASVSINGSRVRIGATESTIDYSEDTGGNTFSATYAPEDAESEPPPPGGWHAREVQFNNTKLYLHGLVPDVAEVLIPVAHKTFRMVPLTAEGLRSHDRPERIELPLVYVPGTRPGTTVMDLDTNFIHFSFAGLMRSEIDRVEMVNPKVHVGDSLFHYVNKLREESKKDTATAFAAQTALAIVGMLTGDDSANIKPGGWTIHRLRAINGKLITTVKDSPLLRVPALPFGADSSLAEGKVKAELAVPPGLYKPVLGLQLVSAITEGKIVFNLPIKDKDNNLVQVFKADWLRYKQFRIHDVALSVTFDANGIYSQIWAKGYGGDLQGAFNLYLDDNLSWDGWVAGTSVDMRQLTDTLTPTYFTMSGNIDFKLIAQGDKSSLYQATAECRNRNSGRMQIVALDEVIASVPKDWSDAQRKWVIKALETVRDFAFNTCTIDLRLYGLEGNVTMRLKGPDGQRNFEIHSHDRRVGP